MRIAFAGKGGTGKTLVVAVLSRVLAASGRNVLAFDFDVNPGLAISLGALSGSGRLPLEAVEERAGAQYGYALRDGLTAREAVERHAARGPDGIRLLAFGVIERAGHDLATTHYAVRQVAADFDEPEWDVLVDMEAGTKDVYDGSYVPFVDLIVALTDGTAAANLACARLVAIARRQNGPPAALLANRANDRAVGDAEALAAELDVELLGAIPYDDAARVADVRGESAFERARTGPAVQGVVALAERLRTRLEGVRR